MNIGAVIVTYNRLDKLKKCLAAYETQTYQPSKILVVNNASTDGTKEYLIQWEGDNTSPVQKYVLHMNENLGGAGGFAEGIRHMQDMEVDWIWIADDDAYPDEKCLEVIEQYYESLLDFQKSKIAAISTKVVDNQRNLSAFHRRTLRKGILQIKELPLSEKDYDKVIQKIELFSFVGTLIRTSIISKVGLPRSNYFIFFDDSEYSLRVSNIGEILCLSNAVVVHDSPENITSKKSWKNFYMFRNKLYTYTLYLPKRYVLVEVYKMIYMTFLYYNSPLSWKQLYHALLAVLRGKLGVDSRYLPPLN